jgi:sarcosine oxidase
MQQKSDIIVVGLGANGSSALYQLSKKGLKVTGIDQFSPPHQRGSSHGQSRIIRQAYYENPLYVPFLREAYKYWDDIEKVSGEKLFIKTGGLMIGKKDSRLVSGSRLSAETHDIPHEMLGDGDIRKTFPALRPQENDVALLEHEAGILMPELCISTFLKDAEKNGAALCLNERVTAIESDSTGVAVTTDKTIYHASRIIVSAGAWLTQFLPGLRLPLIIERQVLYWFKNKDGIKQKLIEPDTLPVFIWEYEPNKMFYGFPDLGDGIKIALHHAGERITATTLKQDPRQEEIDEITEITLQFFDADLSFNYATTCMYTNTPDEHFIIDFHPHDKNIIIASPCSGHGFKFASGTGKILADMALGEPVSLDISPFRIARFSPSIH